MLHNFSYLNSILYSDEALSDSAAQWLKRLLDLLTSIVNRNEDLNQVEVTKDEYHQLLAFLDDFIQSVGGDENHPLAESMTLVGILIKSYEDQHFTKLTEDAVVDVSLMDFL